MRLREAEKLAKAAQLQGILNETSPACKCDFPFPPQGAVISGRHCRSELCWPGAGIPAGVHRPGQGHAAAVTGPLAPGGGRMKRPGGGARRRDVLPGAYGLLLPGEGRGAKTFRDFAGGRERLGLN